MSEHVILITGAAGFIGSHLNERLLAEGHRVVGYDNFTPTYDPAIKRRNLENAQRHENFTFIEGDIRDADAVNAAFAEHRPTIVVHLAALAGVRPSVEQPTEFVDVNLNGTTKLLDAAVHLGTSKFIFGSSSSVYGNNTKIPFAENDPVDRPISPYAATKRAGELIAHTYHHIHGLPISCLRFFTVFGPRQRPDLAIHKFMRMIEADQPIPVFGDGQTSRDYTFVGDIIEGITRAIDHCDEFDILNLGSHAPIKLRDLIAEIEKVVGKKAIIDRRPMQPGDVNATYADLTHAQQALSYEPHTPLIDGLRQQYEWIKQTPLTTSADT